jgi:hypothetical protein
MEVFMEENIVLPERIVLKRLDATEDGALTGFILEEYLNSSIFEIQGYIPQ